MNFNITHGDMGNVIHMQISPRDGSEGYDQHSVFIWVRIESGYDALTANRGSGPHKTQMARHDVFCEVLTHG